MWKVLESCGKKAEKVEKNAAERRGSSRSSRASRSSIGRASQGRRSSRSSEITETLRLPVGAPQTFGPEEQEDVGQKRRSTRIAQNRISGDFESSTAAVIGARTSRRSLPVVQEDALNEEGPLPEIDVGVDAASVDQEPKRKSSRLSLNSTGSRTSIGLKDVDVERVDSEEVDEMKDTADESSEGGTDESSEKGTDEGSVESSNEDSEAPNNADEEVVDEADRLKEIDTWIQLCASEDEEKVREGGKHLRLLTANPYGANDIVAIAERNSIPIITGAVHLHWKNEEIAKDLLWILGNLASSTSSITQDVAKHSLDEIVRVATNTKHLSVLELCVFALGNITGDCVELRNQVLQTGVQEYLAEKIMGLLEDPSPEGFKVLKEAVWTFSNMVRFKPQPHLHRVACLWQVFSKTLSSDHAELYHDTCWALSYISDGPSENIDKVLEIGVLPKLISFLKIVSPTDHQSELLSPALRTCGNIATGSDVQTQSLITAGLLNLLEPLMFSPKENISKEALWLLSNITAGTREQIQAVADANLVGPALDCLETGALLTKREANWVISNLISGSDESMVVSMDYKRMISALAGMVADTNTTRDKITSLEGLQTLARHEGCRQAFFEVLEDVEHFLQIAIARADNELQLLSKLRSIIDSLGLNIEIDTEHDLDRNEFAWTRGEQFKSMEQVAIFWLKQAEMEDVDAGEYTVEVESSEQWGVLQFFSKLRGSKEFELKETATGLAKRVIELLDTMKNHPECKRDIIQRMLDSIDRCDDKPMWALNQMELIIRAARARGDREALRNLGRQILRLQVVHKHAKKLVEESGGVDDVSVYLVMEIDLREKLDLPVSGVDMWFPSMGKVEEQTLQKAIEEAEALTEEDLENFLSNWEEWQREDRRDVAESLSWKELKRSSIDFRKSLRDVFGVAVEDAVRFPSEKAEWSFSDLMKHWVETGMDLHNTPRSAGEIRRLVRARSLFR